MRRSTQSSTPFATVPIFGPRWIYAINLQSWARINHPRIRHHCRYEKILLHWKANRRSDRQYVSRCPHHIYLHHSYYHSHHFMSCFVAKVTLFDETYAQLHTEYMAVLIHPRLASSLLSFPAFHRRVYRMLGEKKWHSRFPLEPLARPDHSLRPLTLNPHTFTGSNTNCRKRHCKSLHRLHSSRSPPRTGI